MLSGSATDNEVLLNRFYCTKMYIIYVNETLGLNVTLTCCEADDEPNDGND